MSHDKKRTYYAESHRQKFNAADHIRRDWAYGDVVGFLENRARGYNGSLRQILCTAAHMLKDAAPVMRGDYKAAKEPTTNAFDRLNEEEVAAPVVSKRNQQPGRLSGSEREALKKFAASVFAAGRSEHLMDEAMAEGRAMLANVRKRALGAQTKEDEV